VVHFAGYRLGLRVFIGFLLPPTGCTSQVGVRLDTGELGELPKRHTAVIVDEGPPRASVRNRFVSAVPNSLAAVVAELVKLARAAPYNHFGTRRRFVVTRPLGQMRGRGSLS
jgi:hypothetical protein